ncbi:DUF1801 domain-containing protein [Paracoccus sp. S-4012]|uniref:DUF1801 domain-containing protein n=1 Tax=Paracoccus sp. S-4012 TaxID=2665648 RepID=UPI0012B0E4D6|nr:DUF1801 domain-containing protein [Paracoccus sp. S-4012]MRX50407.1 DUF1801 domain-containing protein [Paracoccus sp. S-4012]
MSEKPRLLSGGNPQIPKGEGNAPVQAWIAAAPEWKGAVAARIDRIVTDAVPEVRKAVKWNSPLYGAPGQEGWFLSFHAMTNYLKLAFHRGAALDPPPPVGSKQPEVRYYHVGANDLDEAQLADWVRQAAALPGVKM